MGYKKPYAGQGANRYRAFLGLTMQDVVERVNSLAGPADAPVSLGHVANALHGKTRPAPTLRRYLPEVLGISLQACFEDRVLVKPHQEKKARR